MAKAKRGTKKKSSPKKRVTMATKTKRKKRRSTSVSSVRRRLATAPRRKVRRKKKGFLSDGPGNGMVPSLKRNFGGGLGGALFLLTRLFEMPLWARTTLGYGSALGVSMAGAPYVGAGLTGAVTYNLGSNMFGSMLHDDDFQDGNYVDPDTLSDSGYMDDNGNSVLCDEDGVLYQLNDGELEAVGDIYALNDVQSASMNTLANPFELQ